MHRSWICRGGVAVAVGLLVASNAFAAEGRIPIFRSTVLDGTADVIDGQYVVTRNITLTAGPGNSIAIQVIGTGTESVDIDLNGFVLNGDPMEASYTIDVSNVRDFKLRNGRLTSSVSAPGCLSISNVNRTVVENVLVDCGNTGIAVSNPTWLTLSHNTVVTEGAGIVVTGSRDFQGTIERNQVSAGGPMGSSGSIDVSVLSTGLKIIGNQIDGGGGAGISIQSARGALIADNSVRESAGVGIVLIDSNGCRVRGNSVVDALNSGIGLFGTNDSLVLNNVVRNNGYHGISVSGMRNHLDRNVTNLNGGGQFGPTWGLHFGPSSSGNTYGRNTASGNTGDRQFCPSSPSESCGAPELCDEGTGNKSFGDNLVPGPPIC